MQWCYLYFAPAGTRHLSEAYNVQQRFLLFTDCHSTAFWKIVDSVGNWVKSENMSHNRVDNQHKQGMHQCYTVLTDMKTQYLCNTYYLFQNAVICLAGFLGWLFQQRLSKDCHFQQSLAPSNTKCTIFTNHLNTWHQQVQSQGWFHAHKNQAIFTNNSYRKQISKINRSIENHSEWVIFFHILIPTVTQWYTIQLSKTAINVRWTNRKYLSTLIGSDAENED